IQLRVEVIAIGNLAQVPRHEQIGELWVCSLNLLKQLRTGNARHDHVRQEKVNVLFFGEKKLQGFLSAASKQHEVAGPLQNTLDDRTNAVVVLGNENSPGLIAIGTWRDL